MIETSLNMFDIIVLSVMGISCLVAFFRGLVREILSLVAWVGAAIVTMQYFKPVMELTKGYFKSETVAAGAAVIGLYIAALVAFSLVNWLIIKAIKQGGDGGALDNMLGLGFGVLRGAIIISLGYFMLSIVISDKEEPKWLAESVTKPYVKKGATILASLAPKYLSELSTISEEAAEMAQERRNRQDGAAEDSGRDDETNDDSLPKRWEDIKEGGSTE